MRLTVKITKDILERSKFCGYDDRGIKIPNGGGEVGRNCGVALAVRDLLDTAWVNSEKIWVFDVDPTLRLIMAGKAPMKIIQLPHSAQRFIEGFDSLGPEARAKMKPFSFKIEVPDSVIDNIGIEQVYKILSKSKTLVMEPSNQGQSGCTP